MSSDNTRLLGGADKERVECPNCDREGYVEPGKYLCSKCGAWFEVTSDD